MKISSYVSITLQPFRKLKLWTENAPNGNTSISQKLPYISKKKKRLHKVVFQPILKINISQNCIGNSFFAFTGHLA